MAHLDIRPANILLAPLASYNAGKRRRVSSQGSVSPSQSRNSSEAAPSISSFSLFASIQQSMNTPRDSALQGGSGGNVKDTYEEGERVERLGNSTHDDS